jgi:hypothetical protein
LHSSYDGSMLSEVDACNGTCCYLPTDASTVDIELRFQDRRRVLLSLDFPSDEPEGRKDDSQKQVTLEGTEVDGMRVAVRWRFYKTPDAGWVRVSACIKVRPKRVTGLVRTACQLKFAMEKRESEYLTKMNAHNAKRQKIRERDHRLAAVDESIRKLQVEQEQLLADKAQLVAETADPPANEADEAPLAAFIAAASS